MSRFQVGQQPTEPIACTRVAKNSLSPTFYLVRGTTTSKLLTSHPSCAVD